MNDNRIAILDVLSFTPQSFEEIAHKSGVAPLVVRMHMSVLSKARQVELINGGWKLTTGLNYGKV